MWRAFKRIITGAVLFFAPMSALSNEIDSHMGVGIHPKDFYVYNLDGTLLFVDDRKILTLLGKYEGPKGYDTIYFGSRVKPNKPITEMTINEVQAFQQRMKDSGSKSTAIGAYQFIMSSLHDTAKKAKIPFDEKFDRFTQDRLARSALRQCGFYRHDVLDTTVGDCLAGVWAALPMMTGPLKGQSRYKGIAENRSLTTIDVVLGTIQGRFRNIAFASEIRGFRGLPVQNISDGPKNATLVEERSAETGQIVFSVSKTKEGVQRPPRREAAVKQDDENQRQVDILDEIKRLAPFNGYVKEVRAPEPRKTNKNSFLPAQKVALER